LSAEFMVSPTWNILYTSFSQLSNLLCLPIWIISYTLLYFDSRVRKEAYDLELLAREVNPGFYWQPQNQPRVMGYQMPYAPNAGRQYVQTSPLGLAGWQPRQNDGGNATTNNQQPLNPGSFQPAPQPAAERPPEVSQRIGETPQSESTSVGCRQCQTPFEPGAKFCMRCGAPVQ
jgi:hypothetical protein